MSRSALFLCSLALSAAAAASLPSAPHGGVYRGPGGGVGPGGAGPGTATPGTAAPGGGGGPSSDWTAWWSFNRDPFLALKDAIHSAGPVTGGEDFYLGRGQGLQAPGSTRPTERELRAVVVPALIRALEREDDQDPVTACLLALAKIGLEAEDPEAPRLEELFASRLASRNQEIAETAALAFGVLGRESTAPLLGELVADSEGARRRLDRKEVPARTRALAAYGLGLVAYRSPRADARGFVVQRLTGALADADAAGPDLATACLLSLGLVRLPSTGAWEPEADFEKGLLARSREELCAWLLAWFREAEAPDPVRAQTPVALARASQGGAAAGREAVARELLHVLRVGGSESQDVRRAATIAVGLLGPGLGEELDAKLRDALLRLVSDRDAYVRGVARISLARVAGRGAGEDGEVGATEARGWLLRDLARSRTTARAWSALALGVMEHLRLVEGLEPTPEVRVALRESLRVEGSPSDAGALCIAAGLCRDLDAAPLLRGRLVEQGPDLLRAYAAVGLGLMGAREAVDDLRAVVRQSTYEPGLQREAALALGLLHDRQVVPDLAAALRDANTLSAQSSLASALGTIGDSRAIPPLLELLADLEVAALTRAFAAAALGIVGDKERLPWNSKLAVDLYYGQPPPTLLDPLGARGVLDLL